MKLEFQKNHGLGNDFVILNNLDRKLDNIQEPLFPEFIRFICDRNIGIGGDGLLIISNKQNVKDSGFDIQYTYYNCDGNEAEICGNGLRCFTKALFDTNIFEQKTLKIKTKVGIHDCKQLDHEYFEVEMGKPKLNLDQIPAVIQAQQNLQVEKVINERILFDNEYHHVTMVNMGNPHCVIFVDDVKQAEVERFGKQIQNSSVFPQGVNVGFAQVMNRNLIELRVYERGCGETQACGSGACASVVAGVLNKYVDAQKCQVNMHQGQLDISIDEQNFNLTLRGQAMTAFSGQIDIQDRFLIKEQ